MCKRMALLTQGGGLTTTVHENPPGACDPVEMSQAAAGDPTRAHAAFARMRAVGAWQMHDTYHTRFVNVLLDAYDADFEPAWQWCGTTLLSTGSTMKNMGSTM
jgi:hypothetical protein